MSLIPGVSSLGTIKTILWIMVILVILLIVALAYLNRNSEKVVLAILPAAGIAFGGMLTISYTLKAETKTIEFFSHSIIEKSSHLPIWMVEQRAWVPLPFATTEAIKQFLKKESQRPTSTDTTRNVSMQYELRILLDTLFQVFPTHWDMKLSKTSQFPMTVRFQPFPGAPQADFISWETIQEKFHGMPILEAKPFTFGKMGVPEGTHFTVTQNREPQELPGWALSLENRFFKFDLTMVTGSGIIGVGYLTPLLNYSSDQSGKFWTDEFHFMVKTEFNPLLQGHPDMIRYKRWLNTLCEELREKLDLEIQWQHARDRLRG